jgi:6-pyruvoyltetrahydropterin/6-carboxytetrahydropterin synthase
MKHSIRAEVTFCAGHRLLHYAEKCASPHGHNYRAEIVIRGDSLNSLGMLADFGTIKNEVRAWIGDHWDHAFLVNSQDHELIVALARVESARVFSFENANPTAEVMAAALLGAMRQAMGDTVRSATIWESELQWATCEAEETPTQQLAPPVSRIQVHRSSRSSNTPPSAFTHDYEEVS